MAKWSKKFTEPYSEDDLVTLLRLSTAIDELWEAQINLRKEVEAKTQDSLSVDGYEDDATDSHTITTKEHPPCKKNKYHSTE